MSFQGFYYDDEESTLHSNHGYNIEWEMLSGISVMLLASLTPMRILTMMGSSPRFLEP